MSADLVPSFKGQWLSELTLAKKEERKVRDSPLKYSYTLTILCFGPRENSDQKRKRNLTGGKRKTSLFYIYGEKKRGL